MFDDIIGETKEPKELKIRPRGCQIDIPSCESCIHGSHILSNYPNMVLCQMYKRHKDFNYACRNWDERK